MKQNHLIDFDKSENTIEQIAADSEALFEALEADPRPITVSPAKLKATTDALESEIKIAVAVYEAEQDLGVLEENNSANTTLFPQIEAKLKLMNSLLGTSYWYSDDGLIDWEAN